MYYLSKILDTFLKSYRTQNHSILILTSHDMDDVEEISERIIIINQGQKIFDGKMDKLLEKFGKKRQVTFILSKPLKNEKIITK